MHPAVVFGLLWLAGLYLRLPVLIAPPLSPGIAEELGLISAGIGALTTIPVLFLSLAAIAGAFFITLAGARRAVAFGLLVVALTSAARGLTVEPWQLYAVTGVMGLGIAIMQPALPALLTLWCPTRIALGTAVYMNGMLVGEVMGAGLTLPVFLPLAGGDWRLALMLASVPALLTVLGYVLVRSPGEQSSAGAIPRWMPDWRHPLVWRLGILLGANASVFFGTNAYMATVLGSRGEDGLLAPGLLLFNSAQVLASLMAFRYAARWVGRDAPLLLMLVVAAVCLLLYLALSGAAALIAAFMVSFTTGVMLILLVSIPPAMGSQGGAAALAAGVFTVGYALSFAVPLIGGFLADWTGMPLASLGPALLLAVGALPLCLGIEHMVGTARSRL